MSVFDKIKNALFEEEYVEVEEKPKKKKIKEKPRKEIHAVKEEKPIAKKVVLPEKKEEEKPREEEYNEVVEEKEEFKFPMMDEDDFKVEDNYVREEPEIVKVIEKEEVNYNNHQDFNSAYGKSKPHHEEKPLYGSYQDDKIKIHEYGGYEKHEEKKAFKPSPIISPIYGVLDKNYKKEEIVTKREVRLTSSYAREHLSVDDVRNKAYGIDDSKKDNKEIEPSYEDVGEEENLLVDLTSSDEKPKVHEVTMGDAEEYFQDLGLEYNIDYKDVTKERATGRREKENYDEVDSNKDTKEETKKDIKEEQVINDVPVQQDDIEKEIDKANKTAEEKDEKNDDNLFDLIDSMYEEEN